MSLNLLFFGLVLISAFDIRRIQIKLENALLFFISLGFSFAFAYHIESGAFLMQRSIFFDPHLGFFFLMGILVSGTLLVPGLSGSYLLLLFGVYEPLLRALRILDMPIILSFLFGMGIGIPITAHAMKFVMNWNKDSTLSILTGLVLGSLYMIFPFSQEYLGPFLLGSQFLSFLISSGVGGLIALGLILYSNSIFQENLSKT